MEDSQAEVDRLLWRGVFFSIVWLAGVGSFISVRKALKAKRLIMQSHGQIRGMGKVWWCLIVGGFGLLIWGGGLIFGIAGFLAQSLGW